MVRRLQSAVLGVVLVAAMFGAIFIGLQAWWATQDKSNPMIALWSPLYENIGMVLGPVAAFGAIVIILSALRGR